jgi:hypothetical protein
MRLSRHAKNWTRQRKWKAVDVEEVIAHPTFVDWDDDGRPRFTGEARGVRVRVVVALDDPELIVTIHERRR